LDLNACSAAGWSRRGSKGEEGKSEGETGEHFDKDICVVR